MTLKENLGIESVESLKFPCEGSLDKIPVLFIEFSGRKLTRPVIDDVVKFLRDQYEDVEISDLQGSPNIASIGSRNPLMEYMIQPEPEIFQVRIDCKQEEDNNTKIWFFEGYQKYKGEKVDCERLIEDYIERLNQNS